MKVTVIGSHLCPDTLFALNQLCAKGAEVTFKDILSCHADLLDWLEIRRTSAVYDGIRDQRRLGIPCLVKEDGTVALDLEEVLAE